MIANVKMFRKGWAEDTALAESEIPIDPALPHLSTLLNDTVMGGILRDAIPGELNGASSGVVRCRLVNMSYRPGRRCGVSYMLNMDKTGPDMGSPLFVTANAMPLKSAERHFSKRMATGGPKGIHSTYLSDYAMTVTAFPNDLCLFGLRRLFDLDYLDAVTHRALGEPAAKVARAEDGSPLVSVVSYRPEMSCLFRCVIQRPSEANREPEVIYGRMYRDNAGEEVHRAMTALWNGAARRTGVLSVAEPLGYDPVERVLFQGTINGTCLGEMAQGKRFLDYIGPAALSLAAIHQCPIHLREPKTAEDALNKLALKVQGFVGVFPEFHERLDGILRALRRALPCVQGQTQTPIHGDFSLNQVLVNSGRVSIIDFDTATMGDPLGDAASFLARLEGQIPDRDTRYHAAEIFRREYEGTTGMNLSMDCLDWYQTEQSLRQAFRWVTHFKPGWRNFMDHSISRSSDTLTRRKW